MNREIYPCPACGFEVFDEPPGSYCICDICGWEDDEIQLRFPDMRGGANGESLIQAQKKNLESLPLAVSIKNGRIRAKGWRPFALEKDKLPGKTPASAIEYFNAREEEDSPVRYYWESA